MDYRHDSADSTTRRASLSEYIERELLRTDRSFICRHCVTSCRPSAEAQSRQFVSGEMPHFGDHYSLIDKGGRPIRIVVMGQERGVPKASSSSQEEGRRGASSVSMEERTKVIQANRPRNFRKANSHISGTVFGLMAMYKLDVHGYRETIDIDGAATHVLDAFVLTNSTLCSAVDAKGKGRSTPPMQANCVEHARAMLRILAPTYLVLQGKSAGKTVSQVLGMRLDGGCVADYDFSGQSMRIISLPHPTSQGATNWSGPNREYFRTTASKLLQQT